MLHSFSVPLHKTPHKSKSIATRHRTPKGKELALHWIMIKHVCGNLVFNGCFSALKEQTWNSVMSPSQYVQGKDIVVLKAAATSLPVLAPVLSHPLMLASSRLSSHLLAVIGAEFYWAPFLVANKAPSLWALSGTLPCCFLLALEWYGSWSR